MTSYDKTKFQQVMMTNEVKAKYDELVRYYRFINKCHHINDFLEDVFDRALDEIKQKEVSVLATSKVGTPITLKQSRFIEELRKNDLHIDEFKLDLQREFKFPISKFELLIKEVFKVRSKHSILTHKNELLEKLNLQQIRISNSFYIAHNNFDLDSQNSKLDQFMSKNYDRKVKEILTLVKSQKNSEISEEFLAELINGDRALAERVKATGKLRIIAGTSVYYHTDRIIKSNSSKMSDMYTRSGDYSSQY